MTYIDNVRDLFAALVNDTAVKLGAERGVIFSEWARLGPGTVLPRCRGVYELRCAVRRPSRETRGEYVGVATSEEGFRGRLGKRHTTLAGMHKDAASAGQHVYYRLIVVSSEQARDLEGRKTRRHNIGPDGAYSRNRIHGRS